MTDLLLYDTTLRDGAQTEGISFSVDDKVKIARKLDQLGIHYIEGGFSHPSIRTDMEFFARMREEPLDRAKLVVFGMTRRAGAQADQDPGVRNLVDLGAPVAAIVAKTWDHHVTAALRVDLEENLAMIRDTVRFVKDHGVEICFDAEHFFDGLKHNRDYALECIRAAAEAGADSICLCDTNGGVLPHEISEAVEAVRREVPTPLGIHAHDDCQLAVANTLAAVQAGAVHVQGTFNGYGERCGTANLCSVIPNLQLKLGRAVLAEEQLAQLYETAHYIASLANMPPPEREAYVGRSAFCHKGGMHVDAMLKSPRTYEHIRPEQVGNERRFLVSDLGGRGAVILKAQALELGLDKNSPQTKAIMERLKEMEHAGYQFDGAEASFELLVQKSVGRYQPRFDLEGFRVIVEKDRDGDIRTEATIKLKVDGEEEHTAAVGDGPVHALDNALRKALERFYPQLSGIRLTDFKVRVVDAPAQATAAAVRVMIESRSGAETWTTVGVHTNIIEASWQALVDGVEYGL
ncbi:MAG: citramalate synthase, partial [Armatimonadota bacterium]|nr:citramalate synthase [Armatimonadota bacterium]